LKTPVSVFQEPIQSAGHLNRESPVTNPSHPERGHPSLSSNPTGLLSEKSQHRHLLLGLFTIAFGHLVLETSNNFLPILYPSIVKRLGLSYTQVGLIALVHGAFGSFPQPVFGLVADRTGGRALGWASIAWLGIWAAAVGFTQGYAILLICVSLMGIASAMYHPVGASGASEVFPHRPGAAISIFSLGGNIGAALSPVIVAALVSRNGLPGTIWLLPVGIMSSLILRHYLPSLRPRSASSTSMQSPVAVDKGRIVLLGLVVAISTSQAWFTRILGTYTPLLLAIRGQSETAVSLLLFVMSICSALGTIAGGVLSDRLGPTKVIAVSWTLAVPTAAIFFRSSNAYAFPLAGTLGFLTGMSYPLLIVLANRVWSHRPALAMGLTLGIGWGFAGVGVTAAGAVADRYDLLTALNTSLVPAGFVVLFAVFLHVLIVRGGIQRKP